jgi:anti-sigma-K factor RskA
MSVDHDHADWAENMAAYCLEALEPDEAAEFERHLAECERCRSQLRWFGPAVDVLPQSVERCEPPPELRSRLMAQVRAEAAEHVSGASASGKQGLGSWLRERLGGSGSWSLPYRPLAGLAAVLLIVGVVAGYVIGTDGSSERGSGDTVVTGQPPGVVAEVVREGDGGTLRLDNVRSLPDERVLQAWVQRDGDVTPVPALFVPDHDGRATTTIEDLRSVERVMVTTEPPGGSGSPTSAPIVAVSIPG